MLPRELKVTILYFLPYYQLKETKVFKSYLQQNDLVTLLLLDGTDLEQIHRLLLPITDRKSYLAKFDLIYIYRNHLPLMDSHYPLITPELAIQQAFMDKSLAVLKSIIIFDIELPVERKFTFYVNDLTWSDGLEYICNNYTGTITFPSIFEVRLNPRSEQIIRDRLLDHKDEQDINFGYSGYLNLTNKVSPATVFCRLLKLRLSRPITLDDVRSPDLTQNEISFIATYFNLETGPLVLINSLQLVKPNLVKRFDISSLKSALNDAYENTEGIIPLIFNQLTPDYVADCAELVSYIDISIAPSPARDQYLAKLETVLDVENRSIDDAIHYGRHLSNIVRTGNVKQIKQVLKKFTSIPIDLQDMNTFVYYDLYDMLILIQDFITDEGLNFFSSILYRDRLLFDYYDKLLQDPRATEEFKIKIIKEWGEGHRL